MISQQRALLPAMFDQITFLRWVRSWEFQSFFLGWGGMPHFDSYDDMREWFAQYDIAISDEPPHPNVYMCPRTLLIEAKTLRQRAFSRLFNGITPENEITLHPTDIKKHPIKPFYSTCRSLMAACYRDKEIRAALRNLPIARDPISSTADPELEGALQDLADIVAWEAHQAFVADYYPRPIEVDAMTDDEVDKIMWGMQREMDREGSSRNKQPPIYANLPRERQIALSERRRYWFCFAGNTKVFKADLTWAPISSLKEGDELLTLDEYGGGKNRSKRKWRYAKVIGASSRLAETCLITLNDGTKLRVTEDHPLLTQAKKFCLPKNFNKSRGGKTKLMKLLDVWDTDKSYEAGWLAGFFDGEGTLSCRRSLALSVSQVENSALKQVKKFLTKLNFTWSSSGLRIRKTSFGQQPLETLEVVGKRPLERVAIKNSKTRKEVLRFLGSIRPVRLLQKFKMPPLHMWGEPIEVADIKFDRLVLPVYNIETTAKTFIADGYLAHNCQFGITPESWKTGRWNLWRVANVPYPEDFKKYDY